MKLSTKGRYGVKAMVELAIHYGSSPLSIWLNPSFHSQADSMYWMESEGKIRELVDMYPLTVDGLKHGIKKLMSDKK